MEGSGTHPQSMTRNSGASGGGWRHHMHAHDDIVTEQEEQPGGGTHTYSLRIGTDDVALCFPHHRVPIGAIDGYACMCFICMSWPTPV